MPKSKETMEMIALQVPKAWKEKLEAYCSSNGYSLSYAIRKAVEQHIISPNFTWENFIEWRDRVNKILEELITFLDKFYKNYREDTQKIADTLKPIIEGQKISAQFLEKLDARVNQLDSRVQSLESQILRIANILDKLADLTLSK